MPQINFDEVPDFENLDPGDYHSELTKATEGVSQAGHPKIDLQWKVVEEGKGENRVLFDTISFAPKALSFTKRKLIALGIKPNRKGEVNDDMFPVGEVFVLRVAIQNSTQLNPDTGEVYDPRNSVKAYKPSNMSAARLA